MTFVDVLWRGEMGGRSLETVGKVDAESRLRGLRRDLFAGVALDKQAHQLLALLLIFRQEVDGFSVGMAMHGVARPYHVDLSEGEERENGVDDGRDGGESEGGDGGRGPGWTGFMDFEVVDRIEEAEHTGGKAGSGTGPISGLVLVGSGGRECTRKSRRAGTANFGR